MLHLKARIHFHEPKLTRLVEKKLHRACTDVPDRRGRAHRGCQRLLALGIAQNRGRRLLDELLVLALHRAVPLPEVHDLSVLVGKQLDLDVAPAFDQLLEVEPAIGETSNGLRLSRVIGSFHFPRFADDAHASPATPALGLQQDGESNGIGDLARLLDAVQHPVASGNQFQPGGRHGSLGGCLATELLHDRGRRADEGHAMCFAQGSEQWILGEESPAWVKCAAPGLNGSLDDALFREVALARPRRSEQNRLTAAQVRCISVGLGDAKHRCDAEPVARPCNASCDLASVRYEKTPKSLHGRAP